MSESLSFQFQRLPLQHVKTVLQCVHGHMLAFNASAVLDNPPGSLRLAQMEYFPDIAGGDFDLALTFEPATADAGSTLVDHDGLLATLHGLCHRDTAMRTIMVDSHVSRVTYGFTTLPVEAPGIGVFENTVKVVEFQGETWHQHGEWNGCHRPAMNVETGEFVLLHFPRGFGS